jgi:hypothetical protein
VFHHPNNNATRHAKGAAIFSLDAVKSPERMTKKREREREREKARERKK